MKERLAEKLEMVQRILERHGIQTVKKKSDVRINSEFDGRVWVDRSWGCTRLPDIRLDVMTTLSTYHAERDNTGDLKLIVGRVAVCHVVEVQLSMTRSEDESVVQKWEISLYKEDVREDAQLSNLCELLSESLISRTEIDGGERVARRAIDTIAAFFAKLPVDAPAAATTP